jgi:IclR family transcriptional regulator, acetate operon repressor
MDVFSIAKPEVDDIARETGELANLLVEEHGRGSYLYRARGDNAVQVDAYTWTRVHLHNTALGKAILTYLSEDRRKEILDIHGLPASTDRTITDRTTLYENLDDIRERGYAVDDEERLSELRCVAAPILSNDDRVFGSISVVSPTNRLKGSRFTEEIPEKLLETVNVIELNVTYS